MAPQSISKKISLALIIVCAIGLWLRISGLELASFLGDEAMVQVAAARNLENGTLPALGLPSSTSKAEYGPTAIWFYMAVQKFFDVDPKTSIWAALFALTAAQVFFALGVARFFRRRGSNASLWIGAICFSSPFLFYWSRLCWDNPLGTAAAVAGTGVWYLCYDKPSARSSFTLGLLGGIACSVHLMNLPWFALATIAWLLICLKKRPLKNFLALATGACVFLLPYAFGLIANKGLRLSSAPFILPRDFAEGFFKHLLQASRVLTVWKMDYLFDADANGDWSAFLARFGKFGALIPLVFSAVGASFLVLSIGGMIQALRLRKDRVALLWPLGLWFVYALFYSAQGLGREPHYAGPVWWTAAFFVTLLIVSVKNKVLARSLSIFTLTLLAMNLAFISSWKSFLAERGGTRGAHYGASLGTLRTVSSSACQGNPVIFNSTSANCLALTRLMQIDHGCTGKKPMVCGVVKSDAAQLLSYSSETGPIQLLLEPNTPK